MSVTAFDPPVKETGCGGGGKKAPGSHGLVASDRIARLGPVVQSMYADPVMPEWRSGARRRWTLINNSLKPTFGDVGTNLGIRCHFHEDVLHGSLVVFPF